MQSFPGCCNNNNNNNNHIDEEKSSCHEVRSHQQQRRRRRQQVAGVCECRRALFPAERTPAGRPRTFRPLSRGVARTLISGRHVASSSSLGVLTPFATSTSAVNVWTAFKQEEFGFLSRPFIRRSRSRRRNGRYKVQIWCWVLQQVLDFRYVNESLLSIPNIQCRCAARYHFWNILQHLSTCDVLCIVLNYFQNIFQHFLLSSMKNITLMMSQATLYFRFVFSLVTLVNTWICDVIIGCFIADFYDRKQSRQIFVSMSNVLLLVFIDMIIFCKTFQVIIHFIFHFMLFYKHVVSHFV